MASRTAAGDAPNRVPSGTPEVARRPRANRFEHPETDCFVKPTVPRTRGCIFRGVSTDFLHDPAHRTACNQTTVGRPNLSWIATKKYFILKHAARRHRPRRPTSPRGGRDREPPDRVLSPGDPPVTAVCHLCSTRQVGFSSDSTYKRRSNTVSADDRII